MTTNQPAAAHTAAERIAGQHLLGDVTDNTRPWSCSCGESFRTNRQWSTHVIVIALAASPAVPSDPAALAGAADERGPIYAWPRDAADFAARWNAMTAAEREERAALIVRLHQEEVARIERPVVPSDHTATTEDAVVDLLGRLSSAVTRLEGLRDEHWDPAERQRLHGKAEGVKLAAGYVEEARGLLATARPDTTTDLIDTPAVREVQAQALEAAAAVLYSDDGPGNPLSAATWLRERAAAIREGADR